MGLVFLFYSLEVEPGHCGSNTGIWCVFLVVIGLSCMEVRRFFLSWSSLALEEGVFLVYCIILELVVEAEGSSLKICSGHGGHEVLCSNWDIGFCSINVGC